MPWSFAYRNVSEKEPIAWNPAAMVSCFCIVVAIHISAYMFLVCDFMRFTDLLFSVTNIQIFFNVTGFAKFFLKKRRWSGRKIEGIQFFWLISVYWGLYFLGSQAKLESILLYFFWHNWEKERLLRDLEMELKKMLLYWKKVVSLHSKN